MMDQHQRRYLDKRRREAKEYLGGVCVECGATERLEFDHVDPSTKEIAVSAAIAKHWAWSRLLVELKKCQLLCHDHHVEKSRREGNLGGGHNKIVEPEHGTNVMFTRERCRCERCRQWKALYRAKLVDSAGRTRSGVTDEDVAEARLKVKLRGDRAHGTYARYKAGCHCSECRAANAAYMRAYKETRACS